MSRSLSSLFCDDIRQELGNKFSMMGIYHAALLVEHFPVELPRLFVTMKASASADDAFSSLRFKVLLNDDLIVDMDVPAADLERPIPPPIAIDGVSNIRQLHSFQTMIQLPPLRLEKACILRTRIETERETLWGDGLMIGQATPD